MRSIAPGKLILTGEYAVLHGAPGLVMAVNRHARVTLQQPRQGTSMLESVQLQRTSASLSFDPEGNPLWADARARASFALVDTLLRHRASLGLACIPGFDAQLDTQQFFDTQDGGRKLGLGSSAALIVALSLALRGWAGGPPTPAGDLLPGLIQVHANFQGGRGSGIDLAASLHGGLLEYRRESATGAPVCRQRRLPPRLMMRAVWTGRSASTPVFLATLQAASKADPAGWQAMRHRLVQGAERACQTLARLQDWLEAVSAYGDELRALGAFAGLPIYSPEHQRLAQLAVLSGVTYKPSGAGGGDLGLALGDDPDRLEHFCKAAMQAGFRCPALDLEPRGAHLESPD